MVDFAVTAFVSILFLVDPPGTVPAFLALTARYTPACRRRTAFVAALAATLTMMGFALVGNALFRALNLTIPAFQIAGGMILFLVALDMIRSETGTAEHQPSEEEASATTGEVAITPLAVPLLAGPAALSTVAVLMARADGIVQMASVFAAIAFTGLTVLPDLPPRRPDPAPPRHDRHPRAGADPGFGAGGDRRAVRTGWPAARPGSFRTGERST